VGLIFDECFRIQAYLTLASITMTWIVGRRLKLNPRAKIALHSLLLMGYTQALLGITTLVRREFKIVIFCFS
jgi:hypothetical protein